MLTNKYKTFGDGTVRFFDDGGNHLDITPDELDMPGHVNALIENGIEKNTARIALKRGRDRRNFLRDQLQSLHSYRLSDDYLAHLRYLLKLYEEEIQEPRLFKESFVSELKGRAFMIKALFRHLNV